MIKKKSWEEFRENGLLWWVNTFLHLFGWAIVLDYDENNNLEVYPARVKFRGFSTNVNDKGYRNMTEYLKKNCDELLEECELD